VRDLLFHFESFQVEDLNRAKPSLKSWLGGRSFSSDIQSKESGADIIYCHVLVRARVCSGDGIYPDPVGTSPSSLPLASCSRPLQRAGLSPRTCFLPSEPARERTALAAVPSFRGSDPARRRRALAPT